MKFQWNPWAKENWAVPESEWNDPTLPMITLGVLNYNRCTELRQTLDVLTRAVQYPHYEIIVVDNGSTDGSLEMVRTEFPHVRLKEVGENLGIYARNFQTQLARGKYLFSFDDDTCPATPAMVLRIVRHFEAHPEIDALSTRYYRPLSGMEETKDWEFYGHDSEGSQGIEGVFIVEGGVCFRLASLRKVEGYDPRFLVYSEGMELGLQLRKNGFRIFLCPQFATLHFVATNMRPSGLRAYANSRHMLWTIAKHWPAWAAVPLLALLLVRRAFAMAMHRATWRENAHGLADGFSNIRAYWAYQPKLSATQIFQLNRFYLFFYRWA